MSKTHVLQNTNHLLDSDRIRFLRFPFVRVLYKNSIMGLLMPLEARSYPFLSTTKVQTKLCNLDAYSSLAGE
jgi:hypothetical protein